MKSKLQSLAILLILVFLVFAGISVYFGKDFADRAAVAEAKLAKTQADLSDLLKVQETVASLKGPPDAYADRRVMHTVSEFSELANKLQFNQGLKITGVALNGDSSGVNTSSLKSVPSTADGLKYIDLKITGVYKNYEGFLEYLALLHTLPVAITKIEATGKQFQVDVHVFGV